MDNNEYQAFLRDYSTSINHELIPAATVILVRDQDSRFEVLLLQRSKELKFVGGFWVFPGGRIDPEDFKAPDDLMEASRSAAVREAKEETDLDIEISSLVRFSHWVPPPANMPRLFATWFFLAPAPQQAGVTVDGSEICDYMWVTPEEALKKRDAGELEFAPPTFITLQELAKQPDSKSTFSFAESREPPFFATRIVKEGENTIALWHGDAGFETSDPSTKGPRHRLVLSKKSWQLEKDL